MQVKLLHYTPLEIAVYAIRICYDSKGDNLGPKDKALVHRIIELGHTSTIEHIVYNFEIKSITRVCLAQLTRHRIASYSVKSHRYVKVEEFNIPESIDKLEVRDLIYKSYKLYQDLIDSGVPKEDARFILPQAATTDLIMSINARSLRNFFKLRLSPKAQHEIRQLAQNMLNSLPEDHIEFFFYDFLELKQIT